MMLAWFFAAALVADTPPAQPPPPDVLASYREARDKAGRSPGEQVRLALWCESHGLTAERLRHLALAVLADPGNAAARGLLGLVPDRGRWSRPEAIAVRAKDDPTLAEYEAKRLAASYTADGQWALGLWAEEHGLIQQARVHLTAVIRLDPSREAAWKKLGYRRFEGRWRTDAQVAADKAEVEAQERADRSWGPLLARWKGWLGGTERRAEAQANLDALADPRAVASVVKAFGTGGPEGQAMAVRLLGQIDAPASSRALAILATYGKSPQVRRVSAEILAHRDPREYLGLLIGRLRKPLRYEMGLNFNAFGLNSARYPYIAVEGEKGRIQANSTIAYAYPPGAVQPRLFADSMPFDPYGAQAAQMFAGYGPSSGPGSLGPLAGLIGTHGSKSAQAGGNAAQGSFDPANAMVYQATLEASRRDMQLAQIAMQGPSMGPNFRAHSADLIAQVEANNVSVAGENTMLYASLGRITGQDLPEDPDTWRRYWVDSLGYSYGSASQSDRTNQAKPTFEYTIVSCFAAGTPVRTLAGDRPIESLKVGDQVLAQDTATGSLRYRSIAGVHHNPPAMALRVKLGDEVILATGFHRFWKPGKGWVMARELKAGDSVRTLDGLASVASIEPDRVQPVFNLDVADDADFFVGKLGALVHDNSLPDPRLAPFDAAAQDTRPAR